MQRIAEVGDVWLDAGIVPFSTLGWENPKFIEEGYATGAAKGLTTADLPDHGYWEEWFPADWVSEMREQIRLWFYSQLFMSVTLTGQAPYRKVLGYEKMLDEQGREMHGSWGNAISADEAFAKMGADVMRWQYCQQPPNQNLLFGFGPGKEIQRKLLTCGTASRSWPATRTPPASRPAWLTWTRRVAGGERRSVAGHAAARPVAAGPDRAAGRRRDGRLRAVPDRERARAFESYLDDMSNWYIRRSRRRFWNSDEAALRTLWSGLVQSIRVHRAGDAVPGRAHVAVAGRAGLPGRAGVGVPGRLAGGRRTSTTSWSPTWPRCGRSSTSAAGPGRTPS